MSMISGQVDRLRTAAQTYRRLGNHSAESMLLDAADTIWQLRDDLQRANAENAKLRDELDAAKHDLSLFSERIVELGAENAKLRRLVMDYNYCILHVDCAMCKYKYGGTMSEHCPLSPRFPDIDEPHELRVEVE